LAGWIFTGAEGFFLPPFLLKTVVALREPEKNSPVCELGIWKIYLCCGQPKPKMSSLK
jgi:hypothetical protein